MTIKGLETKVQLEKVTLRQGSLDGNDLRSAIVKLSSNLEKLASAHNKQDDTLTRALRGGISSANNERVLYKTLDIIMPPDAPWLSPSSLDNSFANVGGTYPPFAYLMEPGGHAQIRGRVDTGTSGTVLKRLPAGYAPPYDMRFAVESSGVHGSVIVNQAGDVIPAGALLTDWHLVAHWIAAPAGGAAMPHAFPAPWPIVVNHGWSKCLGLTVESCLESTSGVRTLAGAPVADWEDIGSGQLRLNGVWGLQWGKAYRIRVRLSAEEE